MCKEDRLKRKTSMSEAICMTNIAQWCDVIRKQAQYVRCELASWRVDESLNVHRGNSLDIIGH